MNVTENKTVTGLSFLEDGTVLEHSTTTLVDDSGNTVATRNDAIQYAPGADLSQASDVVQAVVTAPSLVSLIAANNPVKTEPPITQPPPTV